MKVKERILAYQEDFSALKTVLQKGTFEPLLFLLVVLINLSTLLSAQYFVTYDGASHLYNARIMHELLFEDGNSIIGQYFTLNTFTIPNCSGHLLLTFFLSFLPAYLADKLLLILLLVGLPYAFRYAIKTVNGRNAMAYLIFPFTYSVPFTLGFYNFSLGLIFFFLTIASCIRHYHLNKSKWKSYAVLFILFMLLYSSHFFLFMLCLLIVGCYIGFHAVMASIRSSSWTWTSLIRPFRTLIPAIPWLILAIIFYSQIQERTLYSFIPFQTLWDDLLIGSSIIVYQKEVEVSYTRWLPILFAGLTLLSFYQIIHQKLQQDQKAGVRSKKQDNAALFRLLTMLMLILYFFMPNANDWSGYVSIRLQLLFYLFWVLYLALTFLPKWSLSIPIIAGIFFTLQLGQLHQKIASKTSKSVKVINEFIPLITEYSLVFPIHYSHSYNWLLKNSLYYLGVDKAMVLYGNYETQLSYFPVKQNPEQPGVNQYEFTQVDCELRLIQLTNTGIPPDYIYLDGSPNPETACSQLEFSGLEENGFKLIKQIEQIALFERLK